MDHWYYITASSDMKSRHSVCICVLAKQQQNQWKKLIFIFSFLIKTILDGELDRNVVRNVSLWCFVFHFSQSGLIVTFVWMKKNNERWRKNACYMKVLWVHWNVFREVGYIKVISHYANCLFMMPLSLGNFIFLTLRLFAGIQFQCLHHWN